MKRRHNKKRNTALVYEALIKEATAAILRGDHSTKEKVVSIVKKHFGFNSVLRKDLQCYQSLAENQSLSTEDSRRILNETKMQKRLIDPTALFKAQSEAIKDVNIQIDSDIFNNFVPNYKTLATIDQMFSLKTSPKDKVLLENEIMLTLLGLEEPEDMAKNISKEVGIDDDTAQKLVADIALQVFKPIRERMQITLGNDSVRKTATPTTHVPETKSAPSDTTAYKTGEKSSQRRDVQEDPYRESLE